MHDDPAGTDPETSDASLRAALANERANAEQLRELSRQQAEVLRRPLVRVARALDGRTRRYRGRARRGDERVATQVARAQLVARSVATRSDLADRRTRIDAACAALDPPLPTSRRVSIIVVSDAAVTASPRVGEIDHELVFVLTDPRAAAPVGIDRVVVKSHQSTATAGAIRGAARATGAVLCFLAPTSEPLDPGWLARLVAVLDDTTVAATPMLIHPERSLATSTPHDLLVRVLGLDVVDADATGPRMVARHAGEAPAPGAAPIEVAAGSGACLVVERAAFDEAGGLVPIDDLDAAMVDLCGRLRAGNKRVVAVPSAVVVDHRPVASMRALETPIDPTTASWRAVVGRQGSTLAQLARGDRV